MAGGPRGWLIAGNRDGGAAVWNSPDATKFTIVENVPVLSNDAALSTAANDAVAVDAGWLDRGIRAADRPDRPGPAGLDLAGRADVHPGAAAGRPGGRGGAAGAPYARRDPRPRRGRPGLRGLAGRPLRRVRLAGGGPVRRHRLRDGRRGGVRRGARRTRPRRDRRRRRPSTVERRSGRERTGGRSTYRRPIPPGGFTAAAVAGQGATVLLLADDGVSGKVWAAPFTGS